MAKKILIIDGHPDPDEGRLCHALAKAYWDGARDGGHEVRDIEIARFDFPILQSLEDYYHGEPCPSIKEAQQDIDWADHIVHYFPSVDGRHAGAAQGLSGAGLAAGVCL